MPSFQYLIYLDLDCDRERRKRRNVIVWGTDVNCSVTGDRVKVTSTCHPVVRVYGNNISQIILIADVPESLYSKLF